MKNAQQDVIEFHRQMDQPVGQWPTVGIPADRIALRQKLIREEVEETLKALQDGDLVEVADGICDSIYVLIGTAVECGIDLDSCWREVQRSNMAKAGGPIRADGKRLKPEGWTPPDISGCLSDQLSLDLIYEREL